MGQERHNSSEQWLFQRGGGTSIVKRLLQLYKCFNFDLKLDNNILECAVGQYMGWRAKWTTRYNIPSTDQQYYKLSPLQPK